MSRIIIFSFSIILFFGLLQIVFFRLFNKEWWQKKWLRILSWSLPVVGMFALFLWGFGEYTTRDYISFPGAVLAVLTFILEFCLILSLPFSGILHGINHIIERFSKKKEAEPTHIDVQRRRILKSAAAAIPIITLTAGASGVVRSLNSARVYKRVITFPDLPADLHGLKILHLSDLHIRHYVTLQHLEDILLEAAKFTPDLVLITGDIADDLSQLPETLKMIADTKPRFGSFASLGNHEYFRGVDQVRRIFSRSEIPLFEDTGTAIPVKNNTLFVGGLDDPRRMGAKEHTFFRTAIDKTLVDDPGSDFKILMSHRPDALDYASEVDVDLVLSGHTHGGQIGVFGRSLFESYFPDRYLWGEYTRGKTKLYTSSGAGHWFPFRLGCPPEAPIIELVKS